MMETLKRLFWIARPVSWPNTAYPFGAAYLLAGGQVDLTFIVGVLYFLGPYNLLMYGVNDVFDYESDIRNPRKGGIEGMREQKAFHPTIMRAAVLSNVPFLAYLLVVGGFVANLLLVVVVFFVVAYSLGGLRFKEKPLLDSVTSSMHFVGPMVYGLALTQLTPGAWPFIGAFFLWGMASHAFGAVQDILPDREGGLSSVATFLGARATVWLTLGLYISASALLLTQSWPAQVVGIVSLIYSANILPYLRITDMTSAQSNIAWRRFIWLNYFTGFVITMVLLAVVVGRL